MRVRERKREEEPCGWVGGGRTEVAPRGNRGRRREGKGRLELEFVRHWGSWLLGMRVDLEIVVRS